MLEKATATVRFLTAAGMLRNYVRYLLMALMAGGFVSQELADNINQCDEQCDSLFRAAEVLLSGIGIVAVESLYAFAKKRGWTT